MIPSPLRAGSSLIGCAVAAHRTGERHVMCVDFQSLSQSVPADHPKADQSVLRRGVHAPRV
ncbi:hypothetical protein ACFVW1_13255 [Streptomyces olivochromogenes]|uniref:hypothetical protein n=1 Tax=Streptomyces olivochromogenes TaxID=1963 RepID=UPI0036D80A41